MSIKEILDYVMHTPSNSNRTVLESLLNQLLEENSTEITDATAVAGDLKKGKIAYNNDGKFTGTFDGVDTKDANATAGDILAGKTAYINNVKVTGTAIAKEATTITPNTQNQTVAAGTHLTGTLTIKGDANLLAENIKQGVTIFGIEGTYAGEPPA